MGETVLPISVNKLGTFSQPAITKDSLPLELWDLKPALPGDDAEGLLQAVTLLQHSSIPVAFPTETVYGLGADATRSSAVRGIFAAKQRPSDNPLIVHIASLHQLRSLLLGSASSLPYPLPASTLDPIPQIYIPLIRRFWPGPLTILLPVPASSPLAPETTAGLSTFGARMPRNILALALIHLADRPIAAPSANASTKPSPTAAEHVLHDLRGRIELILDGGPCDVGVESTVVDGLCDPPVILRPGGVSLAEIRTVPGWEKCGIAYEDRALPGAKEGPRAPGMKYRHYSPKAKVVLFEAGTELSEEHILRAAGNEGRVGVLVLPSEDGNSITSLDTYIGPGTKDVARGLFSALRDLDRRDVDIIFVEGVEEGQDEREEGDIAAAVMNRLRKAAEEHVAS
ncbi:translation factor [Myriangium duriaei CBS 260.36]|uniref:Threonylcarbamoyl-AMP synthase n=1 Tax=Myriangium duriaei CBS 260.36 TaxID=1168546 RepID=A0A9P4JAH4_9PEZI|nr:translation factor [Myriangium duriaei CBS 260.36]